MSEIPEWAMQKAKDAWRNACNYPQDHPIADGRPTVEIARALMSADREATERERERCDAICAHAQEHYKGAIAMKIRREIAQAAKEHTMSDKVEPVKAECCKLCIYWQANYRLPDTNLMDFIDHGACRRRAPIATGGMMSPMSTIWPATDKNAWCGEFYPVIKPEGE